MARVEDFAANILAWCRENPNDCRMDYLEVQVDKDTLDEVALALGKPVVAWHQEPCRHDCFHCGIALCIPNPVCEYPSRHFSISQADAARNIKEKTQ